MSPMQKNLLLLGASAFAILFGQNAYAGPLSARVAGQTGQVNPTTPAPGFGLPATASTPDQVAAIQARTSANLALAAARLQAALTAQANARTAAQSANSNVPDGLTTGGLQVDPRATDTSNPSYNVLYWVGANQPTQTTSDGKTDVSITQTQSQAILNWQTFNVGKNTTVNFVQKDAAGKDQTNWVALNKVNDPNAVPSQILGQINAPGSVYVLNKNGVIFGGTSQINVHSLVAAAASYVTHDTDDDPEAFQTAFSTYGLYSPKQQFGGGNSSYYDYAPVFVDAGGPIEVQAGAQIATHDPASVTEGGGFVLLMGGNVSNAGSITTPRGQVELAAGDNFYLRPGFASDGNTLSTTRGNEVAYTLNPGSSNGTVVNTGYLEATTGDITLAGHRVTQDGIAFSTTSVNTRGTIHLLNSQSDATSSVTLTENSLTTVQPDLEDTQTALNSQRAQLAVQSPAPATGYFLQNTGGGYRLSEFDDQSLLADRADQSRIDVVSGNLADFRGDSLTMAQGGQIMVSAVKRTLVETGANLDVSGTIGTLLPASADILAVNIQGNEERDAPVNRDDGSLKNANVYIDIRDLIYVPSGTDGYEADRYYTSGGLLEVGGWLANVGHTIGEWTAAGGEIELSSGLPSNTYGGMQFADHRAVTADDLAGDVVVQKGATLNVSGGAISYDAGFINTSWLMGADGNLYNIDSAPADMVYTGLANTIQVEHPRWITTDSYSRGLFGDRRTFQSQYVVGKDAGTVILHTSTALFEGDIVDSVVAGTGQNGARPAGVTDSYLFSQSIVPLPGKLAIGRQTASNVLPDIYSVKIASDLAEIASSIDGTAALPEDRLNTVWFDADALNGFGLGGLSVYTQGAVSIDAPLTLAPGAAISITAPIVDIAADVTTHGGSFTVKPFGAGATTGQATPPTGAGITLESGVTIDTSGLWINALLDASSTSGEAFINGGSVTLDSPLGITLSTGSLINASSGGAILSNGGTVGGAGGDVSLTANDIGYGVNYASLIADGDIESLGVTHGGALTLSAPTVLIGGQPLGDILPAGTPAPTTLRVNGSLTFTAGTVLSFDLHVTLTHFAPGQALPGPTSIIGRPVLAQAWTTPTDAGNFFYGINPNGGGTSFQPGQTIPAGWALLDGYGVLPAGYVIPANIFPNGVNTNPVAAILPAGTTLTSDQTLADGFAIPGGSIFDRDVPIQPVLNLDPTFFTHGFSSYSIKGQTGINVADNAQVNVQMPVLRFTSNSANVASGSPSSDALEEWTPPLFVENPVKSTVTQRAGASINLTAGALIGSGTSISMPTFVGALPSVNIGHGAQITVDPGQSIQLNALGQVTVDGTLTAHSGTIALRNLRLVDLGITGSSVGGLSIWLGSDSVLDVSGQAITDVDIYGQPYGMVTKGGSILVGNDGAGYGMQANTNSSAAFVVIRPGAVLNADGAGAALDLYPGQKVNDVEWMGSDGGSITLTSFTGIYNDGTLSAKSGGGTSSGGTLTVRITAPIYSIDGVKVADTVPAELITARYLTITQGTEPTDLPDDLLPGVADSSLVVGQAHISADAMTAGGFDSLVLMTGSAPIAFDGDVNLSAGRSITLAGGIADTTDGATVNISAPYVYVDEPMRGKPDTYWYEAAGPTTIGHASAINVTATGLLDLGASVVFSSADTVHLTSGGDIRFVIPSTQSMFTSDILSATNDLTLTAARIYAEGGFRPPPPSFGTPAPLAGNQAGAGVTAGGDILIDRPEGAGTATIPFSALTQLNFTAGNSITQNGNIYAPFGNVTLTAPTIDLMPGSITSVSSDGLLMPWGGSVDGLNYSIMGSVYASMPNRSVTLYGAVVNVEDGAVIDMSGGGDFQGKNFVSGRQGSSDTLLYPSLSFNAAASTYSTNSGNKIYAIIPGVQGYTPPGGQTLDTSANAAPGIGSVITIPEGVPGLPAGTYTLLPSNYALLPGAYRVELRGTAKVPQSGAVELPDGSYLVNGYQSVANTNIRNVAQTQIMISSGDVLRDHSQYIETTFSQAVKANYAQLGGTQPVLPVDAGSLNLNLNYAYNHRYSGSGNYEGPESLTFNGTALFTPGDGGKDGAVSIQTDLPTEIISEGAAPTDGYLSFTDSQLNSLEAPSLTINSGSYYPDPTGPYVYYGYALVVRDGAHLSAGSVKLQTVQADLTVETGARIDAQDSLTLTDLIGTVDVQSGATLVSQGVLTFDTQILDLEEGAHYGARNLGLSSTAINIGSNAALEAAADVLPPGFALSEETLSNLVSGAGADGAPKLEELTLTATNAINFIGDVSIDTTDPQSGLSTLETLAINSPAVYGLGSESDSAHLTTENLIWNGLFGYGQNQSGRRLQLPLVATPPAAGAPGTGTGKLMISANNVTFGFEDTTTADPEQMTLQASRTVSGFSSVVISASNSISSNSNGAFTVTQPNGAEADLTLDTPLLTAMPGAKALYSASGVLNVTGNGTAPTSLPNSLGSEIDLSGKSVTVSSTIAANSGKVDISATDDVTLASTAHVDLTGAPAAFFDVTEYSWGGDFEAESAHGNIALESGSLIDVSAVNNQAGSIKLTAVDDAAGKVLIDGTLKGTSTVSDGMTTTFDGGSFVVAAQSLDNGASGLSNDFAALNAALNTNGFNAGRGFEFKQGDLVIGDGLAAHEVVVSVDNGSLTVNGRIDASGATPGNIRLAAMNDLTLASTGVLDAHGTVLQVDGYGNPIDAENRGHVELAAVQGMLILSPGGIIDVRVTDPRNIDASGNQVVNYGDVELDAHRTSETSGDINISAPVDSSGHGVVIEGAGTIALNGFWNYSPTDPNGTIVQDNGGSSVIGSNLAAITTTSLETLSTETKITKDFLSTTTTVTDIVGGPDFPVVDGVTFTSLPTPNLDIGERTSGRWFYFPGYCGAFCSDATVIAGQVTDNAAGHTYSVGQQIGYFTGAGAGTTFSAGTKIEVKNVAGGTILFTFGDTQVKSSAGSTSTVVSQTTVTPPPGTPVGTVETTVDNPDGSQTVTSVVTTSNSTTLSDITTAALPGKPTGTVTTFVVNPDGSQTTTTAVTTATDSLISKTTESVADSTPLGTTTNSTVTPDGTAAVIVSTEVAANPNAGFLGLNQIDTQSQAFMTAAAANGDLANHIGGLSVYGSSFHLRPGVEIDSAPSGKLTTNGDLDFAGFRYSDKPGYGLQVVPGHYGSGEPGMIVVRAAGDLDINGNVSDGFLPGGSVPVTQTGFFETTVVKNVTALVESNVALTEDVTITNLPTPDPAFGQSARYGYFYFGNTAAQKPLIVAGEVDTPFGTFLPNQRMNYFGIGTVFKAGTIITLPTAADGVPILSNFSVLSSNSVPSSPSAPAGTTISSVHNSDGSDTITAVTTGLQSVQIDKSMPVLAAMMEPGALSWSMRFVSGGDLTAADTRTVQSVSAIASTADSTGAVSGDLILNNPVISAPFVIYNQTYWQPLLSVLRTGTGDLDLVSGHDFKDQSGYGIYTSGTQSPDIGDDVPNPLAGQPGQPATRNAYDPGRIATGGDGTMLGAMYAEYASAIQNDRAYYPTDGGDLFLSASGDVSHSLVPLVTPSNRALSDNISDGSPATWLWRAGGEGTDQATAWWINFGTYTQSGSATNNNPPLLVGFQGIGTLGGGNLIVRTGGDVSSANFAVGATGRVTSVSKTGGVVTGGTVVETGGGFVDIDAGGDVQGSLTNLRGTTTVLSGSVGAQNTIDSQDVDLNCQACVQVPYNGVGFPDSLALLPGDGAIAIQSRGGIFIKSVGDPGFMTQANSVMVTFDSGPNAGQTAASTASFSFWTPETALSLTSAGGPVAPLGQGPLSTPFYPDQSQWNYYQIFALPSKFSAIAYNGDLDFGAAAWSSGNLGIYVHELMPAPDGQLTLLTSGSIEGYSLGFTSNGNTEGLLPSQIVGISGANYGPNAIANPFRAVASGPGGYSSASPFAFEPDAPVSDIHAGDTQPVLIYAGGDINSLGIDDMAKPVVMRAGGDILYLTGQITNNEPGQVSVISADGRILYPNIGIGGPGALEVQAGGSIIMGQRTGYIPFALDPIFGFTQNINYSTFTSTGLNYDRTPSNVSGGAGITVMAGLGAEPLDYTDFAALYLDPANQADLSLPLEFPENQGKVAHTYQDELYTWLQSTHGYTGTEADQIAFFDGLAAADKNLFLRDVFYDELIAGAREFNDPSSRRFQSYLRSRMAIASLIPAQEAATSTGGDITMAGGSGIRTLFGGDIQILAPNGLTQVGVEGVTPSSTAGVITQGAGDIDIYSLGSVELGQSRIFTTFGGDILVWSALGDINAGRGAKTTIVYTPARRVYDLLGNVTLSPTVPSQGAGIGTLAPIAEVPPGDVDLIAPFGTIDAGEAGIRVSGNLNVIALHIVNADNIAVKGKSFGLPPQPTTNLTLATVSNATTEANNFVKSLTPQQSPIVFVEVTGYGGESNDPTVCVPNSQSSCAKDGN